MKAKDFSLPDQNNKIRSLSDYSGKWVVLYFYPKDDTPGCTKEACNFRDEYGQFQKMGAQILGVSKDSVASHKKFSEKYNLNFPILSDESAAVIKNYNSWGVKKMMGRQFEGTIRNSFLIGPDGEIKKSYEKVSPVNNPGDILRDLKAFTRN